MLPPVLEIYVVWHPGDLAGKRICDVFLEHFHGNIFSGLIGGAIEVYGRSDGWMSENGAPRPIPFQPSDAFPGMKSAEYIAVVPILGNSMARAVQNDGGSWRAYVQSLVAARTLEPQRINVFPYVLDHPAVDLTVLDRTFAGIQRIAANAPIQGDNHDSLRNRDLAQGMAQLLSPAGEERLTVFISHTKRGTPQEAQDVDALVRVVREVIGDTRLAEFFDANDLQPGRDWEPELRRRAATSALLALRTDLYSSREWCQREMLIAKREGMPVIVVDALGDGEERGSFLMDHVPRIAARISSSGEWRKADIVRALDLLVDECLKRAVWRRQAEIASGKLAYDVAWWAPHAPEPITFSHWLDRARRPGKLKSDGSELIILHPDPPLGAEEKAMLEEMLLLAGIRRQLDIMTPRLLAARSG